MVVVGLEEQDGCEALVIGGVDRAASRDLVVCGADQQDAEMADVDQGDVSYPDPCRVDHRYADREAPQGPVRDTDSSPCVDVDAHGAINVGALDGMAVE